jgi:site-specific recombinase XerD
MNNPQFTGAANPLLTAYLTSLERRGMSPRTIRAYRLDLLGFSSFLRPDTASIDITALASVTGGDVDAYVRHLVDENVSHASLKRIVVALRSFYGYLRDQRITPDYPVADISISQQYDDAIPALKLVGAFRYLATFNPGDPLARFLSVRSFLIMSFMILYGVRQCQIRSLEIGAVKWHGKDLLLRLPSGTDVSLSGPTVPLLKLYLSLRRSSAQALFVEQGTPRPITRSSLQSLFTQLSCSIDVAVSPKTIHHSRISLQADPEARSMLIEKLELLSETLFTEAPCDHLAR